MLLFEDGNAAGCELLTSPGPNIGRPGAWPWGDWKGFAPEGTLSRRPGVLLPGTYMLWDLEWVDVGDAMPEAHRGLLWAVENVAEVGVLKSLGDAGRYEYALSAALRYDSRESLERGSAAMTSGGGRRRASAWVLYEDPTELMLAMLDVESDLECPRAGPPALPPVDARALLPACLTLSVLIWRWNLEPVAASESMGMSSLTCTVWACCLKLSSLEKRREQWH